MARSAEATGNDSPRKTWRSRWRAAVSTFGDAVAHAPENAAYGLLAFAALGAGFAPVAMGLAWMGTIVANAASSLLGAGRIVSGQRAALTLLTASLVSALVALLAPHGGATAAQVVTLCAIGVAAAGALQMLFGLLKLGTIVKYTPHPVRAGVTSGVGLLLIVTALPVIAGNRFGAGWRTAFEAPQMGGIAIGLVVIAVNVLAARLQRRVPPVLLALAFATLLHHLLAAFVPGASLGLLLDAPELPWLAVAALAQGTWAGLAPGAWAGLAPIALPIAALLGVYAVTVAVLCSLDALLVVSVVDTRLRRHRDPNRELCGQGVATLLAGLASGQAPSPSIPKSLALAAAQPDKRHAVLAYAAVSLLLLGAAPGFIGWVPGSAIGGVLLLQGVLMISPAIWRAPRDAWRWLRPRPAPQAGEPAPEPLRGGDRAIELAVAVSAVVFGLGHAVVIGASCAVLLFVRANMRDVVRREWSARTRRSLKARPSRVVEALANQGARITLLELEGPLFFGTADGLRSRLDALESTADTVILDLHRVTEIDVTAARILAETARHWASQGRQLMFSETSDGALLALNDEMDAPDAPALQIVETTDLALEQAEERLLVRMEASNAAHQALTLADSLLGRGLGADDLAWLAARMQTLTFASGQVLFRVGDPGDGFYISLAGDIGLRMPGSGRRLASFSPGVVMGEMATLTRGTRSAEAYAESDVVALRLGADDFDRLMVERPELAAKVLRSIALHLADRVRTLTGDLSHWVARAAPNRT